MVAENSLEKSFPHPETVPVSMDSDQLAPLRKKRTWRGFVRDLFLYFLTYLIISGILIGPMFWIWYGSMFTDGPKWIARFFLPLAFLCEICPPLCRIINDWVNWWIL
jgi:hypothetical protein